ncbi:MAG TPA: mechanosensitive ion channel protein MscS, partial [Hyphomonadaceae bacterium]|nr:mechanosensitive ion channel protein MscS [Hyphomonadaceae bacterium]
MTSASLFRLGLLTLFLSLLSPLTLQAQDASQTDAPISLEEGVPDDAAILERIDDIFAQLESLQGIEASVQSGVVTLSGTTTNADAIDLAETLSARVEGVVAVQNQITRDASVTNRVTP